MRMTKPNMFLAQRDLHREEMTRFGHALPWLADPEIIPEAVTAYNYPNITSPYANTQMWMLYQFASWAEEYHRQLGLAEAFENHDLSNDQRVYVRDSLTRDAAIAYAPGLSAISQIHELVPFVAAREGVDRSEWAAIASKARSFGKRISLDGTSVQGLIREYLSTERPMHEGPDKLDPAKFRLDRRTGIEPVTPVTKIISAAKEVVALSVGDAGYKGVCVALEAKPTGLTGDNNMFDLTWDAYTRVAERYIYPKLEIDGSGVAEVEGTDPNVKEALLALESNTIAFNSLVRAIDEDISIR